MSREAMQKALEALEYAEQHHGADDCYADSIEALRAALAEADPWKEAVHDALVINWTFSAEHENDPRKAVADLIAAEVRIALDPLVSSDDQALIDRGKAESAGAEPVALSDDDIEAIWFETIATMPRDSTNKEFRCACVRAVLAAARGKG